MLEVEEGLSHDHVVIFPLMHLTFDNPVVAEVSDATITEGRDFLPLTDGRIEQMRVKVSLCLHMFKSDILAALHWLSR